MTGHGLIRFKVNIIPNRIAQLVTLTAAVLFLLSIAAYRQVTSSDGTDIAVILSELVDGTA